MQGENFKMKSNKILFALFVCALILAAAQVFFYRYYMAGVDTPEEKAASIDRAAEWSALKEVLSGEVAGFNGETGLVIIDLATGREISFNKDKLFPSASLAKVPLMAACFLASQEGRLKLDRKVTLRSSDKLTGSGALKDMPPGSTFSVENLIGLMIFDSDNTATNILTDAAGLDYLNESFKNFGLKDTALLRKIADYRHRAKGVENYTTAEDMASLLKKIYTRSLVSREVSERCIRLMKLCRFNDRIPKYLPPDITIAHKTGLERGVCHDAGIVFTRKGDFIIVILTKHANQDSSIAKEFIAKVSLLAYNYFDGTWREIN